MFSACSRVSTVFRLWPVWLVLLGAFALPAVAQAPFPPADNVGTFRGRLFDTDTGQPITEDITVVIQQAPDASRRVVDVAGEFVVSDLPVGRYALLFRYREYSFGIPRTIYVTALSTLAPVDIYLRIPGEISGLVLDSGGAPIPGSRVLLVTSEYHAGQLVYTTFSERSTDDRGYYSFSNRTEAGRPYFVLALPPEVDGPTSSGLEATWYPSRPGMSPPFVLRSGEQRRVDLVMEEGPTHCVDGRLTMSGQPAALAFEIAIPEVAGYRGSTGGTRGVIVTGRSDESGQFQACGLWPGEFRIAVGLDRASYGRTTVTIVDSDIHDVVVNAQPPVTLNAEIRLDSGQMTRETYRLSFRPLSRVAFESQPGLFERMDIEVPSEFTVSLLPSTDYQIGLGIPGSAANTYMKEVMCGGTVQRNSLSLGEIDCRLSIVIGTDAGTLDARVVDEDGENDLTSSVCVSPISAITPEEIALQGTCSLIDPETASVSMALRPDRYFAVAVPPEEAVDWIEYFRNNRGQAVRIDIGARSTLRATLRGNPGR